LPSTVSPPEPRPADDMRGLADRRARRRACRTFRVRASRRADTRSPTTAISRRLPVRGQPDDLVAIHEEVIQPVRSGICAQRFVVAHIRPRSRRAARHRRLFAIHVQRKPNARVSARPFAIGETNGMTASTARRGRAPQHEKRCAAARVLAARDASTGFRVDGEPCERNKRNQQAGHCTRQRRPLMCRRAASTISSSETKYRTAQARQSDERGQ